MSALEQGLSNFERRAHARVRVTGTIPVVIGRGDGVLVDLSARGAKVRHASLVRRGATVRISFEYERTRFCASAEVLASRVSSLQGTRGGTIYESRLRFTAVSAEAAGALSRILDAVAGRDVRRWVANLRGWGDEAACASAPLSVSFLRCRLFGIRWEVKCTNEHTQPADGFLIPASTSDSEVVRLCADYERADEDGRRVIRLLAAAAVEEERARADQHAARGKSA
jgi:hypothetical protein